MERRKYPRVPVCCLSKFSTEQKTVGDAVILDLSLGGCRVHSIAPADPGTELDLQIALPDQPVPFVIKRAKVRWARHRQFGVSFVGLRPEELGPLRRLMSSARAVYAPVA